MTYLASENERKRIVQELVWEFLESLEADILSMTENEASGWKFKKIINFDVRHIVYSPENQLRYGHKGAGLRYQRLEFHELIKPLLFKSVLDPAYWLKPGFPRDNLCVLAGLILALHRKLGPPMGRYDKNKMESEIEALEYRHLLSQGHKGLSISDFEALERRHSPIPEALKNYSALWHFLKESC